MRSQVSDHNHTENQFQLNSSGPSPDHHFTNSNPLQLSSLNQNQCRSISGCCLHQGDSKCKQSCCNSKPQAQITKNDIQNLQQRLFLAERKSNNYLEKTEKSVSHLTSILDDHLISGSSSPRDQQQPRMNIIDQGSRSPWSLEQSNNSLKNMSSSFVKMKNSLIQNQSQFTNSIYNTDSDNSRELSTKTIEQKETSNNCGGVGGISVNEKQKILYGEILTNLNFIQSQGKQGIYQKLSQIDEYLNDLEMSNLPCYDFLREDNTDILRILIYFLYDQLEKFILFDSGSKISLRHQYQDVQTSVFRQEQIIEDLNTQLIGCFDEISYFQQLFGDVHNLLKDVAVLLDSMRNFSNEIQLQRSMNMNLNRIINDFQRIAQPFEDNLSFQSSNQPNIPPSLQNSIFAQIEQPHGLNSLKQQSTFAEFEGQESAFSNFRNEQMSISEKLQSSVNGGGSKNTRDSSILGLRKNSFQKDQRSLSYLLSQLNHNNEGDNSLKHNTGLLQSTFLDTNELSTVNNQMIGSENKFFNNDQKGTAGTGYGHEEINKLIRKNRELQSELGEKQNEIQKLKRKIYDIQLEIQEDQKILNDELITNQRLHHDVLESKQRLQEEREDLRQQNGELARLIEEQDQNQETLRQQIICQQTRRQQLQEETHQFKKLQDLVNIITQENDQIQSEYEECIYLLDDSRGNIQTLKNAIQTKDIEIEASQQKVAQLENSLYLKTREFEEISLNNQQIQKEIHSQTERKETELIETLRGSHSLGFSQISYLLLNKNYSKQTQELTQQNLKKIFGSQNFDIIDQILNLFSTNDKMLKDLEEKFKILINGKILSLQDVKFLGGMILQATEILSRHSNNQLPTTVMMLREELEIKQNCISSQIIDANQESQILRDQVQKMNINDAIFDGRRIDFISNPTFKKESQELELNDLTHQDDDEELLVGHNRENQELNSLKSENEYLKNKLETLSMENGSLQNRMNNMAKNIGKFDDNPSVNRSRNSNSSEMRHQDQENEAYNNRSQRSTLKVPQVKQDRSKTQLLTNEIDENWDNGQNISCFSSQTQSIPSTPYQMVHNSNNQFNNSGNFNNNGGILDFESMMQIILLQACSNEKLLNEIHTN